MNSIICREIMHNENLTCVIADRSGVIFRSNKKGIVPMLEFLELYEKGGIRPIYQSDRIIGKAAIIISSHCGIKEIYADVVSQGACETAERKDVTVYCDQLVEMILTPDKSREGPFEAALHGIDEDDFPKVLEVVRETLAKVQASKKQQNG